MSKKTKKRNKGPRKMRMEDLESRTLLAADFMPAEVLETTDRIQPSEAPPLFITPPPGIVIVQGTDRDDAIKATVDGNRLFISVNGDVQVHDASEVDIIAVWAKDGNDRVMFSRSVSQNGLILGGGGNDLLQGGSGHDYILGGSGHDSIRGGAGNDLLEGGADRDRINGQGGDDGILGGLGNDGLAGGRGDDAIAGGSGDDTIRDRAGLNWLFGDGTNEVPRDYQGVRHYAVNYADHNYGNDRMVGGDDTDFIFSGNGNDNVQAGNGRNVIHAGHGNDVVIGGDNTDFIFGGYGSDSLHGEGGNDRIVGDPYDLTIEPPVIPPIAINGVSDVGDAGILGAEAGAVDFVVEIDGVSDADAVVRSVDRIALPADAVVDSVKVQRISPLAVRAQPIDIVHSTSDRISGGDGDDYIRGMLGNDKIRGGAGNDRIDGGTGDDRIDGGDGDDYIVGQAGKDFIYGRAGNDKIAGNQGDDVLLGGEGNDIIDGGDGVDLLAGEAGDDILTGGDGTDVFVGGQGRDRIFARDGFLDYIFADSDDEIEMDRFDVLFPPVV